MFSKVTWFDKESLQVYDVEQNFETQKISPKVRLCNVLSFVIMYKMETVT